MAKTTASATTSFTWDASSGLPLLLAEGTAGTLTTYVYGPGGQPLVRTDSAGVAQFFHADQLASTRVLTDLAGTVVGTYTYDAYGKLAASTGSVVQPLGFTGAYTDAETGMVYLRARYYDPATGQFITRDPMVAETAEAYGYAGGNPLNATDPTGLASGICGIPIINFLFSCDPPDLRGELPGQRPAPRRSGKDINRPPGGLGGEILGTPGAKRGPTYDCNEGDGGTGGKKAPTPGPTVGEVLKGKKGSITRQPLPQGSPSWDTIRNLPMSEIDRGARVNKPGYRTIKKLLDRPEYNK